MRSIKEYRHKIKLPESIAAKINCLSVFLRSKIRRPRKLDSNNELIPNVLAINFPTEITQNWGCKASSVGMDSVLRRAFPLSKIRCHKIYFDLPDIPVPRDPSKFLDYIEYLDSIGWKEFSDFAWADIIIFNGEGTIHEHNDCKINSYIYLKLITIYAAKIKYGKKTAIVNHTLDFSSAEFKEFVKTVYPICDYLSVREPKSKELLAQMGITASLTADTAFIYTEKLAVESRFRHTVSKAKKSVEIPEKYYVFL